jgi:hypothetical protein
MMGSLTSTLSIGLLLLAAVAGHDAKADVFDNGITFHNVDEVNSTGLTVNDFHLEVGCYPFCGVEISQILQVFETTAHFGPASEAFTSYTLAEVSTPFGPAVEVNFIDPTAPIKPGDVTHIGLAVSGTPGGLGFGDALLDYRRTAGPQESQSAVSVGPVKGSGSGKRRSRPGYPVRRTGRQCDRPPMGRVAGRQTS